MCGVRNDSCSRKHKYARTSYGMASESLSRGVDLFFAQEFCFLKQEHGPPRGSNQAKTDVLLTTVLGSLRSKRVSTFIGVTPVSTAEIQSLAFGLVRRQATEQQKHTNARGVFPNTRCINWEDA